MLIHKIPSFVYGRTNTLSKLQFNKDTLYIRYLDDIFVNKHDHRILFFYKSFDTKLYKVLYGTEDGICAHKEVTPHIFQYKEHFDRSQFQSYSFHTGSLQILSLRIDKHRNDKSVYRYVHKASIYYRSYHIMVLQFHKKLEGEEMFWHKDNIEVDCKVLDNCHSSQHDKAFHMCAFYSLVLFHM